MTNIWLSTPFLKQCLKRRESRNDSGFNCLTAEEKILVKLQLLSQHSFIDITKEFLARLLSTVKETEDKKQKLKYDVSEEEDHVFTNPIESIGINC